FRHPRIRARQGRNHRQGERDDQGGCRGEVPLDHRRRTGGKSGSREDHVGEAAGRDRQGAPDRDRRVRFATVRRNARASHRRGRRHPRDADREEGQAEPPRADFFRLIVEHLMSEEKLASRWLVSTDWLSQHLDDPNLIVLDSSYYLANAKRDAAAEYLAGHIPGAQRFDVDAISDHSNPLPHMLPSPEQFARDVGALGVGDGMTVVLYDGLGLYGAARVW